MNNLIELELENVELKLKNQLSLAKEKHIEVSKQINVADFIESLLFAEANYSLGVFESILNNESNTVQTNENEVDEKIEQLEVFLAKRWESIGNTSLGHTSKPDHYMSVLCFNTARIIKEYSNTGEKIDQMLMPSIYTIDESLLFEDDIIDYFPNIEKRGQGIIALYRGVRELLDDETDAIETTIDVLNQCAAVEIHDHIVCELIQEPDCQDLLISFLDSPACSTHLLLSFGWYTDQSPLFTAALAGNIGLVKAILNSQHCTPEVLTQRFYDGQCDVLGYLIAKGFPGDNNSEEIYLEIIKTILNSPHCTKKSLMTKVGGQPILAHAIEKRNAVVVDWVLSSPYFDYDLLRQPFSSYDTMTIFQYVKYHFKIGSKPFYLLEENPSPVDIAWWEGWEAGTKEIKNMIETRCPFVWSTWYEQDCARHESENSHSFFSDSNLTLQEESEQEEVEQDISYTLL